MKKIRLEFCNDEITTILFALQKAIFYTDKIDPAFCPFTYMGDKKKYLDGYREMYHKLRIAIAHLAFLDDTDDVPTGSPSWLVKVFNGEVIDEKTKDNEIKTKIISTEAAGTIKIKTPYYDKKGKCKVDLSNEETKKD